MEGDTFNINYGNQGLWNTSNQDANVKDATSVQSDSPTEQANFQSTIKTSEAKPTIKNYTTDPNHPVLLQSSIVESTGGFVALQHLFDFPTLLNNIIAVNGPIKGSTADEALEEDSTVVDDPEIIALAEKEGIPPGRLLSGLQAEAYQSLETILSKLPKDVADQIKLALLTPNGSNQLPTNIQAQLKSILNTLTAELQKEYGFSPNWPGVSLATSPDAASFAKEASDTYDAEFEKALSNAASTNNLTTDQVATLKTMHYLPGNVKAAPPFLQALLETINAQAISQLQAGFGPSVVAQANIAYYSAVINGDFAQSFLQAMNNRKPPLTTNERNLIEKYFENPEDPSIPNNIKDLVAGIKTSIMPKLILKYGLDTNWQPTITTLKINNSQQLNIANNALNTLQDVYDGATAQGNAMPPGPEKTTFLNYLKLIGVALDKLQQAIYAIQSGQSNGAELLSRLRVSIQADNLAKQEQSLSQTRGQEGKMANMGPMADIMKWATNICILGFAACSGPLATILLPLAIAYITDSAVAQSEGKQSLTQQMFTSITNSLSSTAIGGAGASIICALLAVALSGGNPLLMCNLVFQDSNCVQTMVKAMHGSEMAQNITAAVFAMVAQLVVVVAMSVVTMGATAPALIAEMVSNALNISVKTSMIAVKAAVIATQVVTTGLQVAVNGIQINNNVIQSQLDLLKGESDAFSEQVAALVQILKHLIAQLLDALNGNSDWITSINNFQGQKYTDASQIVSQIYS